jgi:hypothetical protein
MSFFDDAIGAIGQGLAQAAVTGITAETGVNVGGALDALFGNGQTTGGTNINAAAAGIIAAFGPDGSDPDAQVLSTLQADVGQQTAAIAALGTQLNGIVSSLAQITGTIDNIQTMLQAIDAEEKYQAWQTADNFIEVFIVNINAAYTQYAGYLTNYTTTPTSEITGLVNAILNPIDGPLAGVEGINKGMLDDGEKRGALHLWSSMVKPLVQQGQLDYRLAVQQYFQYSQKLTYAQLQAANLLMEAHIFRGDQTSADEMWKEYRACLLSQETAFIGWLVPLVFAGVEGGVFVPPGGAFEGVNFTAYDATLQLNPGIQYVRGDAADPGNAFYEPSRIFKAAEELLATLYVTAPEERRIVVHMSYPNASSISNLLTGLFMTLTPGGTSTVVHSSSNAVLGSPFPFPSPGDYSPMFPDQNIYNGLGFYLNRYVFTEAAPSGLTDGQYQLTDLNGLNGLVPLQTYMSGTYRAPAPPFQQKNVLAYTMQVNSASPFDFMNFVAYNDPVLIPG